MKLNIYKKLKNHMHNFKIMLGILFLSIIFLYAHIHADEPTEHPILRLETEMHLEIINRIGVDAENRYLATASNDKTIRVWELQTGKLLRIIRLPIGDRFEGMLYAVAVSPDGKTLACGGWTGWSWENSMSIYIFDLNSGNLLKRIKGLPGNIFHLVYSKNGKYLAAALGANYGIRVYKTTDYTLLARDKDYGNSSYGADFDNNNRLVTTSYDGYIRLYEVEAETGVTLRLVAKEMPSGGKMPYSVSFSPDNSKIAVGFANSINVNVLSGNDLSLLYSPDTGDIQKGTLFAVSWSSDGKFLYAGGGYNKRYKEKYEEKWVSPIRYPILKWQDAGKGTYTEIIASNDRIIHILPLKDGGIVYASTEPSFGIIDKTDNRKVYKSADLPRYSKGESRILVSQDGAEISFHYKIIDKVSLLFSIADGILMEQPGGKRYVDTFNPNTSYKNGINVEKWAGSSSPMLNGKPLELDEGEFSRSLAIAPEGETFVIGSNWYLRLFDKNGNERWKIPVHDSAREVNISQNGKVVVAALGDGTIRWYRLADGKELLIFYLHHDKKSWIIWTPSGYYNLSSDAEGLIGWHVNNGKDRAADFFPVAKFKSKYYRPDIIVKILDVLDEKEAVRLADEEAKEQFKIINAKASNSVPAHMDIDKTSPLYYFYREYVISKFRKEIDSFIPLIFTASRDGTVKIIDLESEKQSHVFYNKTPVNDIFVADNKIVAALDNGNINIWDLKSKKLHFKIRAHSSSVKSVFVENNKLVSGSYDGTVKMWDLMTGALLKEVSGPGGAVLDVFMSDNKVASISELGVSIWDIKSNDKINIKDIHGNTISISQDKIITGRSYKDVVISDLHTGKLLKQLGIHDNNIQSVFVYKGQILSASTDKTIKIWDLDTGILFDTLRGHGDAIFSVFAGEDKIISASVDGNIIVWDFYTHKLIKQIPAHKRGIESVFFYDKERFILDKIKELTEDEIKSVKASYTAAKAERSKKLLLAHKEALKQFKAGKSPMESAYLLEKNGIENIIEAKPEDMTVDVYANILNDYAFFLHEAGKDKFKVINILQQVIKISPERAVAYLNIGDAYYEINQEVAKVYYRRYVDIMYKNKKLALVPEKVKTILNLSEPEKSKIEIELRQKIYFDNKTIENTIKQSEIEKLMDLTVSKDLKLTSPDDENKKISVYTCREYLKLTKERAYPYSTYDINMASSFINTCEFLEAIRYAKKPEKSFVKDRYVNNLGRLSAGILPAVTGDAADEIMKLAGGNKTVEDIKKDKRLKIIRESKYQLILEYEGLGLSLEEVARADFNRDGYEDIFLFGGLYAIHGTLRSPFNIILTKRSNTDTMFEIISRVTTCTYLNNLYNCHDSGLYPPNRLYDFSKDFLFYNLKEDVTVIKDKP